MFARSLGLALLLIHWRDVANNYIPAFLFCIIMVQYDVITTMSKHS